MPMLEPTISYTDENKMITKGCLVSLGEGELQGRGM
jgi:hypothetical protein